MAQTTSYTPIFLGQFPSKPRARWTAIRKFVNRWCMPDDSPLLESFEDNGLIEKARSRCGGDLSYSIKCWLALVEQAATSGKPTIRDCPAVEPIEEHIDEAKDATVIMISSENDLFWAVANSRLTDDDPPVEVFQKYDSSSPAFVGQDKSVSEFVLKYLCMYNEFAVKNREWFSADGTEDDVRIARDWFDYALAFDSKDGWCGPFEILERKNVVAIVRCPRMEVSVFCDPATLDMPPFLEAEMKRHVKARQEFRELQNRRRRQGGISG